MAYIRRAIQTCHGGQKQRHSISSYSFHMVTGAISWSSKKQHVVALSSTEAEYIAQTHADKEALWLRSFLRELRSAPDDPLILNCDNHGAIALAKDNKFHASTKHIDVRCHFIREAVEDGKVAVRYIPTSFPSRSQKQNSGNSLSCSGCARSRAMCKNFIHLCTLLAY